MTTATSTPPQAPALPPPTQRYTLLGWLQRNLFDGWLNSLLTLAALGFLYLLLRPLLNWAFNSAEWAVIPANIELILRGQYPADQAWRLWWVLYLLGATVGYVWGVLTRQVVIATLVVFLFPLALMLLPFASGQARLHLLIVAAATLAAYMLGRNMPRSARRSALAVITAFVIAALLLIRGLALPGSPLPVVPSNVWGGLLLSLFLAIFGILLSFPLGVALALGRRSKLPALRLISTVYIEIIRGVPLISLLFMAQVMLQLFLPAGFPTIDRALRALAAITLFSAAYTAENVRGGLQAVPNGQYEAAYALGLSGFQTTMRIILPQALRTVIPVLVGQFIALFKDTSLVALVGLFDLLGIARVILGNPNWLGTHREVYAFVALIYWLFCYLMSYSSRRLELAMGIGTR